MMASAPARRIPVSASSTIRHSSTHPCRAAAFAPVAVERQTKASPKGRQSPFGGVCLCGFESEVVRLACARRPHLTGSMALADDNGIIDMDLAVPPEMGGVPVHAEIVGRVRKR